VHSRRLDERGVRGRPDDERETRRRERGRKDARQDDAAHRVPGWIAVVRVPGQAVGVDVRTYHEPLAGELDRDAGGEDDHPRHADRCRAPHGDGPGDQEQRGRERPGGCGQKAPISRSQRLEVEVREVVDRLEAALAHGGSQDDEGGEQRGDESPCPHCATPWRRLDPVPSAHAGHLARGPSRRRAAQFR